MSRPSATRSDLPKNESATQRQLGFGAIGNADVVEEARKAAEKQKVHEFTTAFYLVFRKALGESGGSESLRSRLDETDSFKSDVSKGINRVKDGTGQRKVPLEWLAGVAVDDDGAYALLAGLSEVLGYEPPAMRRSVDPAKDAAECRAILESLPEPQRSAFRQERARRLGVRPEEL